MVGSARRSERAAALVAVVAVLGAVGLGLSGPAFGQPVSASGPTASGQAAPPGGSLGAAAPSSDPSTEPSSSDAPSTDPSSSSDPSTEPSSSDAPSTDPSSSSDPSTEPSGTDVPSTDPSTSIEPSTSTEPSTDPTTAPSSDPTTASSTTAEPSSTVDTSTTTETTQPDAGSKPVKIDPPAPVLDTRSGHRAPDGSGTPPNLGLASPLLPGPAFVTVQLAGAGPIPASGVATVDLVVGAVPGAAAGSVTVWPAGTDRPARATVAFDAGTPASAKATVRLGSGGAVAVAVDGGSTDLTLDVTGYAPAANPPSARFASGPIHGAGFMTVVAELPSGRLVAGGDSQGFFISDDGGRTWLSRNVLRGGADPFASRGVASILVAPVSGPNGSVPTLFAAVGKRDQPTAAMLRSDDGGETWVVDNGGKGIWFDGGNLPGASTPRSRATSRLIAIADRGPYAADRRLFAGDMTGCVWTRPLVAGAAWSLFACLPDPSRSPIRAVAVSSTGDVIIATSRMGLAGSRGGGTIAQPDQAGVWRLAVDPSCAIGLCGYIVPTSPLIMFAAASQSVEEVILTPADHLYVAVVDDRLVNQGARLGGLWAGRSDGSPLVSVGFLGADTLRNVVSVDLVAGSPTVDTVITGASLPKAAATDVERTDFEVTRTRVRWDLGPFPTPEAMEPLAQAAAVDLDLYGHEGLHWFVDGTSVLGDEQYVVSSVEVLSDGRYMVSGKAGIWVYQPQPRADGQTPPPWRPAVFGVGSTFQGDVALRAGTVFTTDADRFLFRADLTQQQPVVRQELDQARAVAADITKGLSVTVLGDGTALAGEATSTFGGLLLAVPPGSAPSWQLPLPVNRQPMALATIGDRVIVGIANNGLWVARWDTTTAPPGLVEWQRLTTPGLPAAQPFETPTALPDDVSPAAAAIVAITKGAQTTLAVETGAEGLWEATWTPGAAPLTWTQVAPPAGLPGGVAREIAYVPAADALFLSGLGTLSRIDQPDRCVTEACPLAPVSVPVVGAAGWTPLTTAYGNVPLAGDGSTLFVVAGADPNTDKPGTVFRLDANAAGSGGWSRMADPDGVAANQLIRPIAVAAEGGRLAITTSGNGLVTYD